MKLQISFDLQDLDKAIEIGSQVAVHAEILEVGSLLLYKYGIESIRRFRQTFPDKIILADSKIIDRGKEATIILSQGGTDWITIMAGTSKDVIHSTCTAAHELGKKVMLDLLDSSSLGQSALEAKSLGADALLFHKPHDEEDSLIFLDKWDMVRGNTNLPIFISGKINRDIIHKIIAIQPDGIIIGKSITDAANPGQEAAFFKEIICPK